MSWALAFLVACIAIAFTSLLTACGGGDPAAPKPAPKAISFYGDSITSGASNTAVDGVYTWLKPSPVEVMAAAGGFQALDFSFPGMSVVDAMYGAPELKFPTFPQAMRTDASPIVVIRYATASALKMPGRSALYGQLLSDMVAAAKQQGKTVVLVGNPVLDDPLPVYGAQGLRDVCDFEIATKEVAKQQGVLFISLLGVPGAKTQDGVHPTREYSDALGRHIAQVLRPLAYQTPI